jgi:hypothetical protein
MVRTDTALAPLITFTLQGDMNHVQLAWHLREYRSFLDRGRPYVALFDMRAAGTFDAKSRKAYADFLNGNAKDLNQLCKGGAFVATSPVVLGALTAVLWQAPLSFPYRILGDVDAGLAWLRRQMSEALLSRARPAPSW